MLTHVLVKTVGPDDADRLIEAFPEPAGVPENRHSERLKRQMVGEITALVAILEGQPVGYAYVRWRAASDRTSHAATFDCAELADLFVAPRYRQRGAGRLLVREAEQVAQRAGYSALGFEVTSHNPGNAAARALYAAMGYADAGIGEFVSGYTFYDAAGHSHRDEEPHRYLIKQL